MPRRNEPTERLCAVTRETRPIAELVRFVLDPEGRVAPDLKRRLPGRGVWMTATRATVETAIRRKLFGKAFEATAIVDPGLADLIDRLLTEAALGTLGMALKAGQVVTGFAKVEAAIAAGTITGLIHAREAAEDGVAKLAAAMRRSRRLTSRQIGRNEEKNGIPVIRSFDGAQLDLALGRSNVIHAALLAGRASESFGERLVALERYRGVQALPMPRTDGHSMEAGTDADPQDTTGS
ncbi:MAG: RNA-binding protein [Ancalomicrobiaceae bacterium]|nr:RNA-binding protein [Ancalomicrobiaceae bacterium]